MIFPLIDKNIWSKKYNLSLDPRECEKCKKLSYFTVSVLIQGYAGLQAKCDCGHEMTRLTPCKKETIEFWRGLNE